MMLRMVLIAIFIFLLSCDSTSVRNKQLQKEIDWETKNLEIVEQNIRALNSELDQIFMRSMKYRFPGVLPMEVGRINLTIKDVPYLKAIEFKFISTEKLEVIFVYKSEEKVKPHFSLFLFSQDGINIYRHDVDHRGLFSSAIKPGKEKEEVEKIILSGSKIAHYFFIQEIKG